MTDTVTTFPVFRLMMALGKQLIVEYLTSTYGTAQQNNHIKSEQVTNKQINFNNIP